LTNKKLHARSVPKVVILNDLKWRIDRYLHYFNYFSSFMGAIT